MAEHKDVRSEIGAYLNKEIKAKRSESPIFLDRYTNTGWPRSLRPGKNLQKL